jgi:hypothetical protein
MALLATLLALGIAQDPAQRARDLIEQLRHTELLRRTEAARELRALDPKNEEVTRLLTEATRSSDAEVATAARSAIIWRGVAALLGEPDRFLDRIQSPRPEVRGRAIERLMQFGDVAAPLLGELFGDLDHHYRGRVTEFLAQTRDARYIETVRPMLQAGAGNETWVLHKLAMLGDASIAPRLRELIASQPVPRHDLIQGIGLLKLAEDIPLMRSLLYEDVHGTAHIVVFALASWPEAKAAAAPDLHRLAVDGVWEAMLLAAEVPQPGLAAVLKERMTRVDSSYTAYPAFALAALGDRDAVPYLLHLVREQGNVAAGLYGLGRLRAREAI